jgi:F0F1-type ATP synthase membrane subunit b/b'
LTPGGDFWGKLKKESQTMYDKRAEEIIKETNEPSWANEGRQMIMQVIEEAKHTLQAAREKATIIEAESKQKAQEIIEETKRTSRAEAEKEAQNIIQAAREEAEHIIQTAKEEAQAAIAKEKEELVGLMKGAQEQIIAPSKLEPQVVATPNVAEKAVEAVSPPEQPTTAEPPTPHSQTEEATIPTPSNEGATISEISEGEYDGELELLIDPVPELSRLIEFQRQLQALPQIKVLRTGGSWNGGGLIGIQLEEPAPLLDMLKEMPLVQDVVDKSEYAPKPVSGKSLPFRLISKPRPKKSSTKRIQVSLKSSL